MPIELGIWRINNGVIPMEFRPLDFEARLENILDENIGIASPNWLLIGRQVRTDYGKVIDLLAIDRDANLVILELKRDKTYRDIIAQVLDYGSWIRELKDEQIAQIFDDYQKRWHKERDVISIDEAFNKKFGIPIPDEMNSTHELVIVSSRLDLSTERVVQYLTDEYGVRINAVFFRVFHDGDREYLSRAWFRDPSKVIDPPGPDVGRGEWNGEYYVSFGYDSDIVSDGLKRGYIVAGGGSWYSKTLKMLDPDDRIWVNVPGFGYVGVGVVTESMQAVDEFTVMDEKGNRVPLIKISKPAKKLRLSADDPDKADYLVRVNWVKTVDLKDAIHEKGFFGNQNSVARPRTPKWEYTVKRLKKRFGVD